MGRWVWVGMGGYELVGRCRWEGGRERRRREGGREGGRESVELGKGTIVRIGRVVEEIGSE